MAHSAHHPHAHDFDWAAMVTLTEREAEVLGGFLDEATAVAALAAGDGLDVRRIIDIGSGPGVGTCALAERFRAATVVAADGSADARKRDGPRRPCRPGGAGEDPGHRAPGREK